MTTVGKKFRRVVPLLSSKRDRVYVCVLPTYELGSSETLETYNVIFFSFYF